MPGGFVATTMVEEQTLQYQNGRGEAVACRTRLFRTTHGYVLIATDLGHHVTETIDRVATIVVRRWELDPSRLAIVEQYKAPASADPAAYVPPETLAFVGFDWQGMFASNPTWRETTRAEVQAALGGAATW